MKKVILTGIPKSPGFAFWEGLRQLVASAKFAPALLLLLATSISAPSTSAQSQEQLYGLRIGAPFVGSGFDLLDPITGAVQQAVPIRGSYSSSLAFFGLTYDGQRLRSIALPVGTVTSKIGQILQADGAVEDLWTTGIKWGWVGIERNPVSGRVYVVGRLSPPQQTQMFLYSYEPNLHQLSVIAPISGPFPTCDSFVISPSGQAFVFNAIGPGIYTLDLHTGVTAFYGALTLPSFTGYLLDAAFDSSGALWVSYEDTWTHAETGIYKIDLATLAHTKIIGLNSAYCGLAWGPVPAVTSYCTAKLSSQGCTPSISALGYPCVVATKGFTIQATDVPNQKQGLLIYSTSGAQSVPFQGGTLCLRTPIRRTPTKSSGGNALPANDCTGTLSIDFNKHLYDTGSTNVPPGPPLPPGTNVCAQWWGRDPGFSPPFDSMLSNAIQFDLAP